MAQYFTYDPLLARERKRFTCVYGGRRYEFIAARGIFSHDRLDNNSALLLDCIMRLNVSGDVLDLGCGYGAIGIITAAHFPQARVWQSDVNQAAVELAAENARLNNADTRVVLSDGYENIPETFEWVLLNPPIHAGKETVYRLFMETKEHLSPGGRFVVVMHKKHGVESALRELRGIFAAVEILERKKGVHVCICTM